MTDQGIKSAATRAEYTRVNGWMAGKGKLGVYPSPRDIHAICSDGRWIRIVWFGPQWNKDFPYRHKEIGKFQNFGWSRWLWLGPAAEKAYRRAYPKYLEEMEEREKNGDY